MEKPPSPETPAKGQWFSVMSGRAHAGAGSSETLTNYVYALDAMDAQQRALKMRGVNITRQGITIHPLSDEATLALTEIIAELELSEELIKIQGLYGIRRDGIEIEHLLQAKLSNKPSESAQSNPGND